MIGRALAHWKCADQFDPTVLAARQNPNLSCKLCEIVILRENNRNVVSLSVGKRKNVYCNSNIDSFLAAYVCVCAVFQQLLGVTQWTRRHMNATVTHSKGLF